MAAQTRHIRQALAVAAACALFYGTSAQAQTQDQGAVPPEAAASAPAFENSSIDARLLYELLIGELELGSGDPASAFQIVLDAAKQTGNEQLFRHATDIALQARAGDQALEAARAWAVALPRSIDAQRYQAQLLVATNKVAESADPLRSVLALTPVIEQPAFIAALPGLYSRSDDHKASAKVIEQVLAPYAASKPTATSAHVAIGRAWLMAGDQQRALREASDAAAADPTSEAPPQLALELMSSTPEAEAIVQRHLQARPDSDGVQMLYARVLSGLQRYPDAVTQLDAVTKAHPDTASPWLTLGALRLELGQPKEATAALMRYVALSPVDATSASPESASPALSDGDTLGAVGSALAQAHLMLAQAAEQQGDYTSAATWLDKVDGHVLEVRTRRASLLARQGKLDEALALIRDTPETQDGDARTKVLAEVQVLREAKHWKEAYAALERADVKFPNDPDLLYEQSMMAEKLNRPEDSERLLRRVIAIKPDHPQAHNALGYSLAERNQRLPEAKSLIETALKLSPGEPFITDSLGWVEFRMGHRDEALRLLRGAYQQRPDPEIAAHLGEVLWVSGDRDEARRVLREGRDRDAANDVLKETVARLRVDL